MIKRRKLPPDNRLDWRDPDMPVLRPAMKPDDTEYHPYPFRPEWIQQYHARNMTQPRMEPEWKDDPSYFWADTNKSKKY